MWFPSFLTFPVSFPSISLPANIQRRFLSYVLKRALGRFFLPSGFDVERIQAQLSEGRVDLDKLEVNVEEINALIPEGLPFTVIGGEVAKVSARVPFPNLWSDPLALTVDSVTLDVSLAAAKGRRGPLGPSVPHIDLASSVTSAAGDFLHDELDAFEGAELDRTIRESLILNPPGDVPGAFPPFTSDNGGGSPAAVESTTVLASLVERVLARLQCRICKIRLRVRYEHEDILGVLELRIGEVRYADETPETVTGATKTVRAVIISNVGVYLLPIPKEDEPHQVPLSRMTSASSYESSLSDDDDYQDMIMSQAVADLRVSSAPAPQPPAASFRSTPGSMYQSAAGSDVFQSAHGSVFHSARGSGMFKSTMTSASGRSVYQSFVEDPAAEPISASRQELPADPFGSPQASPEARKGRSIESAPADEPPTAGSQRTSRSATPVASYEPEETLLMSFGTEDIILRMTTATTMPPSSRDWARDPGSPMAMPRVVDTPVAPIPSIRIDMSVGMIAVALLPSHAGFLLSLAQAALAHSGSTAPVPQEVSVDPPLSQPKFDAELRIKGVYVSLVYDLNKPSDEYKSMVESYFSRPASVYLPIGHLRLKLEDMGAAYSVPAAINKVTRKLTRRRSTAGTKGTVVSITVSTIAVFEYLASAESGGDEPPGGTFPVLIFDANLPKQYDVPPGAPSSLLSSNSRAPANLTSFPQFDSIDWRNAGPQKPGAEKAWRVRPRSKGILRGGFGASPEPVVAAVVIHKDMDDNEPATVELLPVHVFLDLSLVERLLPLLRSLAPAVQSSSEHHTPTAPHAASRPLTSLRPAEDPPHFGRRGSMAAPPRVLLTVRCPMIRLDIRCPAPLSRRGSWGDGAHLRSGIVTLDIHDLNIRVAEDKLDARRHLSPDVSGGINVEFQKVVLLFSRVPEQRSSAFLVIGPLAPDEGDEGVLLPTVNVRSELSPLTGVKTQSVTCKIPCIQAKIRQSTVEGLQFFADDMTHWLDGAFGDGSAPKPRDDLKMIGSRFFGSKSSSSASSTGDYDDEDDFGSATLFRLAVSEVEVALLVPKVKGALESSTTSERIVSLRASDMDVKLESNSTNKQETSVTLTAMDADLFHMAEPGSKPHRLFGRTTPLNYSTHTQPLVHLRFSSLTREDRSKETGIRLSANACTIYVTKDLEWVHDLALYAKTPEGVFEDVVPSEVTKVTLSVYDCSVHVAAPTMPGALLAVMTAIEVRTAMESESDDNTIDIGLSGLYLLAIDDRDSATPLQHHAMSLEAWKRSGYAQLVELVVLDGQIVTSSMPHSTLLDIQHSQMRVTACADSFATLGALAGDLSKLAPASGAPPAPRKRTMALDKSIDVFASVDLDAFGQAPDVISGADMIDDDLPTNLDYLDHAAGAKAPAVDRHTGETLRSWETPDEAPQIQNDLGGGTIKIFSSEPFEEDPDYWNNLPVLSNGIETRMGKMRVQIQDCSLSVYLHDGYDWQKTRKAIEDEIKAMRRRLEKIRQLLASGQKADASVDMTSSVLFNSVYIGFEGREDMDTTQLMAAIDEELLDLEPAESDASSWQTFPDPGAGAQHAPASRKSNVRLRGKRLSRSKKGQIEFSVNGLRADIDVFGADDATASRIHATVQSFEILDHIKTSTWKKFLTEMKADSRGNVRETDADMVRVEITNVRPNLPSTEEEIRVRAKILPLRLHVDQDALDFLKHFFSFKAPGEEPVNDMPKTEPFFQHVEIFPVELKLDYKPKRVDYSALRQGRTIELMNFFHFEGAEMTLRHVTLSGVTGGTRLGDMLQDIWTPDVKSNQLADVISGVSPIRSVVNVGSGVADLILLPIEQYRKDGRIARGVQRGTNSFVRSTAMEMMKLGARLATGTQVVLERAEGVLGPKLGDSVVVEATDESDEEGQHSRYRNQPSNVQEGVKAAYASLSSNINSAAQTILAVPMEVYERAGDDGPLQTVVRAVPIAVLKPMIGASEAVSKTLWGLRNSLDPQGRQEQGDKYK
ncbi:hypothetical protein CC85DRAFT_269388 [Cutaneotrichosporon oleaginosum]|uniref:Autophagy-related protein 2 n=1 Tax=Cutaneotrichosporon oleaginosum TaxID=879819 RepID=A0A0J0XWR2_9TREE|nr:uncharacterized protein CC85DRAFT_269388 [Cutaneotrichosporon oleaginosum]KLT45505.1 hypothetical protein CC85DRAFT_269388 [Cutaneotrichosporon oleaginosum]TXT14540.1 hypothetical protein COLE_00733 [Cutaneotrichosporon oleaginosum]